MITPEQLDTLAHELAADADGMRSLAWMRAHIRGWTPEVQQEAFQRRCAAPTPTTTTEVLPDDPDLWHGGCAPEGFRARCGLPSYSDNPIPTTEED